MNKPLRNTFPKSEKLKSKKIIKELFDNKSSSIFIYPFKVVYQYAGADTPSLVLPQLLVSVSKRTFKKAVDRNRIKRQIKEAYRLIKNDVFASQLAFPPLAIGLIYVAKEKKEFDFIKQKLTLALCRFPAKK